MLEEILSPADCARCEFCCSFRRQSRHLTPYFAKESIEEIRRLYPGARFVTRENGGVTIDLEGQYHTQEDTEEALCYFNHKGCVLPEELKPFDCSLWPFRLMKKGEDLVLALVPSCPWIKTEDTAKLKEVAAAMAKEAYFYAKTHPEIIIEYRDDYAVVARVAGDGSCEEP